VPLEERLRLPSSQFSYLLQEWTQSSVVPLPYAQARALLVSIGVSAQVELRIAAMVMRWRIAAEPGK
jgi:hypothetical protein